jgi:transcriptional regulator GlxA family with amidase domain
MKIDVLVTPGVFDTALSALLDVFSLANELNLAVDEQGTMEKKKKNPFEVRMVSMSGRVHTGQGLLVPAQHWDEERSTPDVVIVPALAEKTPESLAVLLEEKALQKSSQALKERFESKPFKHTHFSAACSGSFLLAESGVLDQQKATTSWWLSAYFRQRFPNVELDETHMVVPDDRFVTAGAALAHFDLALWWVRQYSPSLAALVGRYLMIDNRSLQASYALPDHIKHQDELVQRFETWVKQHLKEGFSLPQVASDLACSERTLARRLMQVLGKTPVGYVQDIRVQRAVHLLQNTQDSVQAISEEVGYQDAVTLRTLLRKSLGKGVKELRRVE